MLAVDVVEPRKDHNRDHSTTDPATARTQGEAKWRRRSSRGLLNRRTTARECSKVCFFIIISLVREQTRLTQRLLGMNHKPFPVSTIRDGRTEILKEWMLPFKRSPSSPSSDEGHERLTHARQQSDTRFQHSRADLTALQSLLSIHVRFER